MPFIVFYNTVMVAFGALSGYLGFSGVVVLTLLALMIVDTVLGIKCARRRKIRFKSRRLNGGIYGKAAAITILLAFAFTIKAIALSLHLIEDVEILAGFFIGGVISIALAGEAYSIARHAIFLTTGRLLPEWHVWIFLIRAAREYVERMVYGKNKK